MHLSPVFLHAQASSNNSFHFVAMCEIGKREQVYFRSKSMPRCWLARKKFLPWARCWLVRFIWKKLIFFFFFFFFFLFVCVWSTRSSCTPSLHSSSLSSTYKFIHSKRYLILFIVSFVKSFCPFSFHSLNFCVLDEIFFSPFFFFFFSFFSWLSFFFSFLEPFVMGLGARESHLPLGFLFGWKRGKNLKQKWVMCLFCWEFLELSTAGSRTPPFTKALNSPPRRQGRPLTHRISRFWGVFNEWRKEKIQRGKKEKGKEKRREER